MSYVYFVESGNGGPVKIGHAADPKARLGSMLTGSAEDLTLIGYIPGDGRLEGFLHDKFSAFNYRGEWFSRNPELELILDIARLSPLCEDDKAARIKATLDTSATTRLKWVAEDLRKQSFHLRDREHWGGSDDVALRNKILADALGTVAGALEGALA